MANAFDKLRAILLDAHRLGIFPDNPLVGVQPPQYDPARAVISSLEQLHAIRTAGDDAFMLDAGEVDIPEGMVIYGHRHFFASNCLSNGIPITERQPVHRVLTVDAVPGRGPLSRQESGGLSRKSAAPWPVRQSVRPAARCDRSSHRRR